MNPPETEIVGLLLAAGASRRFGRDKLLHRLVDGRPMAVAAAESLLPACDRVIAVVRPDRETLSSRLKAAGCVIIEAAKADEGMGASLAEGVRASPQAAGWILALADMPFIQPASHQAVASHLRAGTSLTATLYQGRRGHPVGFSHTWFAQLAKLSGELGGRTILERHADQLLLCPVDDPGVLRDIDHPGDLPDGA